MELNRPLPLNASFVLSPSISEAPNSPGSPHNAGATSNGGAPAANGMVPLNLFLKVFETLTMDLSLFKVRVLSSVELPLSEKEEAAVLHRTPQTISALAPLLPQELRLLEETLKKQKKENYHATETQLKEQVSSMFRFAFEEIALRWKASDDERQERHAPQRMLMNAVETQRSMLDQVSLERDKGAAELTSLRQRVKDMERQRSIIKDTHKDEINAFLKEICVLKEQLLRSYRDKEYVGKPIDMIRLTIEDDAADDVSLDSLLDCRRRMRSIEAEMQALRDKIGMQQADLQSKARFIARMEEKAKSTDKLLQAFKDDVDALNDLTTKLEAENSRLVKEINNITRERNALQRKLETAKVQTKDRSVQTEVVEHKSKFDEGAEGIPASHRGMTRLELFEEVAQGVKQFEALDNKFRTYMAESQTKIDALTSQVKGLEESKKALEEEIKVVTEKLVTLVAEVAELREKNEGLIRRISELEVEVEEARAAEAVAKLAQKEAEEREAATIERCAAQSFALTLELERSQALLDQINKRNAVLCQAYLNVTERLKEIKSRAGLNDYKRRANEYHFKRAEMTIHQAMEDMRKHERACEEREEAATRKVQHIENMMRHTREDMECLHRAHTAEIAQLTERTQTVQDAFEALLADFNRMREDYLKTAGQSATTHLRMDYEKVAQEKIKSGIEEAEGGGAATDSSSLSRQRFVFEKKPVRRASGEETSVSAYRFVSQLLGESTDGQPPDIDELEREIEETTVGEANGGEKTIFISNDTQRAALNKAAGMLARNATKLFGSLHMNVVDHLASLSAQQSLIDSREELLKKEKELEDSQLNSSSNASSPTKKPQKGPYDKFGDMKKKMQGKRDTKAATLALEEQKAILAWETIASIQSLEEEARNVIVGVRRLMAKSNLANVREDEAPPQQEMESIERPATRAQVRVGDDTPPPRRPDDSVSSASLPQCDDASGSRKQLQFSLSTPQIGGAERAQQQSQGNFNSPLGYLSNNSGSGMPFESGFGSPFPASPGQMQTSYSSVRSGGGFLPPMSPVLNMSSGSLGGGGMSPGVFHQAAQHAHNAAMLTAQQHQQHAFNQTPEMPRRFSANDLHSATGTPGSAIHLRRMAAQRGKWNPSGEVGERIIVAPRAAIARSSENASSPSCVLPPMAGFSAVAGPNNPLQFTQQNNNARGAGRALSEELMSAPRSEGHFDDHTVLASQVERLTQQIIEEDEAKRNGDDAAEVTPNTKKKKFPHSQGGGIPTWKTHKDKMRQMRDALP